VNPTRVGVLALQGGYAAHLAALADIGIEGVPVRRPDTLDTVSGLILPGGESTTHLKLIERFEFRSALDTFMTSGKPVLATCAGLILSAREVVSPAQRSFDWLDVRVARNAWGRQVHSFQAEADDSPLFTTPLPLLFIRAPRIESVGPKAEVILRYGGEPIAVRQGAVVGAAFHPELTADRRLHGWIFNTLASDA
jgi:5'-phosphate synthase pdxT subunit